MFKNMLSKYRHWTIAEVNQWESIRRSGMIKFVIMEGVLKWGIFSLVLFLVLSHQTITAHAQTPYIHVLKTALIWFVLSIIYGASLWYFTNKSFNKRLEQDQ